MHIVALAWLFVVVLMGAAEAQAGSIVGGLMTILLYGIVPLSVVLYLLDAPGRRKRKARRAAQPVVDLQAADDMAETVNAPPDP